MNSKTATALAINTKRLMEERGWTQRDLAKHAGIAQTAVGFVLRYKDASDRHAQLSTVDAIAAAFKVAGHTLLQEGGPGASAQILPMSKYRGSGKGSAQRGATSPMSLSELKELLQLVVDQVRKLKVGTPKQRDRLIVVAFDAFADADEVPNSATILKFLGSA